MKVAVFSAKRYDRELLAAANAEAGHELNFFDDLLEPSTVVLATGCGAVCVFVNDVLDAEVLAALAAGGTRLVALRCTGFNNVDLKAAAQSRRDRRAVRSGALFPGRGIEPKRGHTAAWTGGAE